MIKKLEEIMNRVQQLLNMEKVDFKFKPGDTVKVHTKVIEGDTERIQVFDGVIISVRGSGPSKTFTVRKVSYGVGVERIFPVNSPRIKEIELVKEGKVRRAKLNYLRNLSGKASRLEERETLEQVESSNTNQNQITETSKKEDISNEVKADIKVEEKKITSDK